MKGIMKMSKGPGDFVYQEVPDPEATDENLIIEVKAAGICGSDLRHRKFGDSMNLHPPVILGHEFAGIVSHVGKNVRGWEIGDRVVSDNTGYVCGKCYNCATGNYLACKERLGLGYGMNGGFAKYVEINKNLLERDPYSLFRIPDNVSFEEATMLDPLANAYKAVVEDGKLSPGEDIVIYGCGTIGLLAVQIASLAGAARIIAVNRSDTPVKREIALQFGATHFISSENENVCDQIMEITSGEGVPIIIDCAGNNEILKDALVILRKGGKFVKVGYDKNPLDFSLDHYVQKGITIIGHFAYDYQSWDALINLLKQGKINVKPLITHTFNFDEWRTAFDVAERKDSIKVVFTA